MHPPRHAVACLITLRRAISIPRPCNNPHWLQQWLRLAALLECSNGLVHQVVPEFAELSRDLRVGRQVSADIIVVVRHRVTPFHFVVVLDGKCSPRRAFLESYGRLVRAYLSGDNHVSISSHNEQKPDGDD